VPWHRSQQVAAELSNRVMEASRVPVKLLTGAQVGSGGGGGGGGDITGGGQLGLQQG